MHELRPFTFIFEFLRKKNEQHFTGTYHQNTYFNRIDTCSRAPVYIRVLDEIQMECCEKHLKLVSYFSKMFIHKSALNFQCKPDVAHSETKLHLPSQFA